MRQFILPQSTKAVVQTEEDRGFLNNDLNKIANYTDEITYNVVCGYNEILHFYRLGEIKFQKIEDAKEYLNTINATVGRASDKNQTYYSLIKQDGCCFNFIEVYSIKS